MASPRLLLFGPPGAGKSSLLGALAQAASLDAPALQGKLVDKSGDLGKLQKSVYQGKSSATTDLEEYDIRLDGEDSAAATLLDCSGKDAAKSLKAEYPFAGSEPMRRPILDADAVLLVVDASQTPKQLNEDFQAFGRWLNELHETRGRRVDVGALPVYLILTKCDSLAREGDTFAMWMQRIEEGKRKIHDRFRNYLKDHGTGFGSLDVRLWATSIKRPQLADRAAKATEPYGVAELFRESVDAAVDFQYRRHTSSRRLQNITVGLLGSLAMLLCGVVVLFEYQPGKADPSLAEKVQRTLPKSKDVSARLGGPLKKLGEKRQALADIQKDQEAFDKLPKETREAVTKYREEIDAYLDLDARRKEKVKFPYLAKTEKDFVAQEEAVKEITDASKWNETWNATPVGRTILEARKQYERVREELRLEEAWIRERKDAAAKLVDAGTDLQVKVRKKKADPKELEQWVLNYQAEMNPKPRIGRDNVPALRTNRIPEVSSVRYEFLDRFDVIKKARKDWETEKRLLEGPGRIILPIVQPPDS